MTISRTAKAASRKLTAFFVSREMNLPHRALARRLL
jgi:hypothetical protein